MALLLLGSVDMVANVVQGILSSSNCNDNGGGLVRHVTTICREAVSPLGHTLALNTFCVLARRKSLHHEVQQYSKAWSSLWLQS